MNEVELVNLRTKLHRDITKFLNKHKDIMDEQDNSHPVYKEYLKMYDKFVKIEDELRVLRYVRSK